MSDRRPAWQDVAFWVWAIEHCSGSNTVLSKWFPETSVSGWQHRKRYAQNILKISFPKVEKGISAASPDEPPAGWPIRVDEGYVPTANDPTSGVDMMKLHSMLKTDRRSVGELADTLDVAPKTIRAALDLLSEQHLMVEVEDDVAMLCRSLRGSTESLVIDVSKYAEVEFPIGMIADTHAGSKYERRDVLEALYDRFAQAGVEDVYHGGNWIEGEARFNRQDIYAHGVESQVDNFIEIHPKRKGITTHIISGDDHEGWYAQREGLNIGRMMEHKAREAGRNDLVDLGYIERDIELTQPGGSAILRVAHLGGGSTYAHSYTAQKYVESLQGGEKPKILLAGHYHKFNYSFPREVHVVQPGCGQDQTPFMRKKKIQAMVGGCIGWIRQNELGIITSFKVEWFPFFDKKFYTHHW